MITAATIDRLAKLIPRLASNYDGEVVATARAIIATLKSEGRDLHDLAKMLEHARPPFSGAATEPVWQPPENPSAPPWKQKTAGRPTTKRWREMRRSDRMRWLNMILETGELDCAERELIANVLGLLHVGMNFYLERKEERLLCDILARFPVETAHK